MPECLDFPSNFFYQIALKLCPESALLYKYLWIYGDGQLCNLVKKSHISDIFSVTPTVFKAQLIELQTFGLLNYQENKDLYSIDLTPFTENQVYDDL